MDNVRKDEQAMTLKSLASHVVIGIGLVLVTTTLAEAQATRTWVSGVGDDANPCSRTAPCKTFAGAISKTATGGYIDVLDPGGFGAVTITKSITIDGGGFEAGVLVSGTAGIVISGASINVTLRGLDIEGVGSGTIGVNVLSAGSVSVINCNIVDFTGDAINFQPSGAGGLLFVSDTSIRHTNGIFVGNGRGHIERLHADGNADGVRVLASAIVTVRDSHATGGGEGFTATGASAVLNLENSVSTHNLFGVNASTGGTIRVSNSGIYSNTNTGLFNDGSGQIISLGGNEVQGNPTAGVFTQTLAKQ